MQQEKESHESAPESFMQFPCKFNPELTGPSSSNEELPEFRSTSANGKRSSSTASLSKCIQECLREDEAYFSSIQGEQARSQEMKEDQGVQMDQESKLSALKTIHITVRYTVVLYDEQSRQLSPPFGEEAGLDGGGERNTSALLDLLDFYHRTVVATFGGNCGTEYSGVAINPYKSTPLADCKDSVNILTTSIVNFPCNVLDILGILRWNDLDNYMDGRVNVIFTPATSGYADRSQGFLGWKKNCCFFSNELLFGAHRLHQPLKVSDRQVWTKAIVASGIISHGLGHAFGIAHPENADLQPGPTSVPPAGGNPSLELERAAPEGNAEDSTKEESGNKLGGGNAFEGLLQARRDAAAASLGDGGDSADSPSLTYRLHRGWKAYLHSLQQSPKTLSPTGSDIMQAACQGSAGWGFTRADVMSMRRFLLERQTGILLSVGTERPQTQAKVSASQVPRSAVRNSRVRTQALVDPLPHITEGSHANEPGHYSHLYRAKQETHTSVLLVSFIVFFVVVVVAGIFTLAYRKR